MTNDNWIENELARSAERAFPIFKVGGQSAITMPSLELTAGPDGQLWALQQTVFDARMGALKQCIAADLQPCSEEQVRIIVEVRQRCLAREAGDVGILPDHLGEISTYRYERPW